KPPTLNPAELEEMLETEEKAGHATVVGFNFIAEEPRQALKRRILAGEFGRLQRVSFFGLTGRSTAYFNRAPWSGRLSMDGRLVMDSCMGNAMAHYIHNLLFWAGRQGVLSWAEAREVEAEMYRAHAVEGTDTIFVKADLEGGYSLQAALSHACAGSSRQYERIDCEEAAILYTAYSGYRIEWKDGRVEEIPADGRNLLQENHRAYYRYLQGKAERPLTCLSDTRAFVRLCALTYMAAGRITAVEETSLERTPAADGEMVAISGLEQVFERFLSDGVFPGSQDLSWARPGGRAGRDRLGDLEKTVMAMV
ncbi:MAG: gfo/Idh/MocA family oxidoreductase, partial [bacterium]|nr:gfo/Idh/MocA family oxidoreductase [bacterium]